MKNLKYLFFSVFLVTSCKVAEMQLQEDFQLRAVEMPVKGKQSFAFKKHLKFGEFEAMENKNSWPWTTNTYFWLHRKKGRQRIQFTFSRKGQPLAEVYALNSLETIGVDYLERRFGWGFEFILEADDQLSGSIRDLSNEAQWDFVLTNFNRGSMPNGKGFLSNGQTRIDVVPVRRLKDVWTPIESDTYGYAFVQDGEWLGAVRIFSNGKVWMRKGLDSSLENILAAFSATALLGGDLEADN